MKKVLSSVVLWVLAIFLVAPFVWMVLISLHEKKEAIPFVPDEHMANIEAAIEAANAGQTSPITPAYCEELRDRAGLCTLGINEPPQCTNFGAKYLRIKRFDNVVIAPCAVGAQHRSVIIVRGKHNDGQPQCARIQT